MGWGILAGLLLVAVGLVWRFAKLPRYGLELTAAAALLGVAGYAWLGSPTEPGTSIEARDAPDKLDPDLVKSRQNMMGQFGTQAQWLDYADTMLRMGQTQMAVLAMRSGIRDNPRNPELWVGLGNALVAHGNGLVSPAARFAYNRAAQLSPNHPGPPFFLGVALAQEGKTDEAATMWRALLARSPQNAPWRADLENRLASIEAAAP
jgi:cytochrome c-type biogenesis protein CcmH